MSESVTATWYDTASRTLRAIPHTAESLRVYGCGPTVYSAATLGNHRTNITYDTARRGLEWLGYGVDFVINYTDVGHLTDDADSGDDKLAVQAQKQRSTAWDVAATTITSFEADLDALHIHRPTKALRATEHIAEMIRLIQDLEKKGHTYKTSDGVYFDTGTFPPYGELAHLDVAGLQEGARVEKNPEKRHPTDFALWKFSPDGAKRDMEWDSPWGVGFPGWHIECSAMSMEALGSTLDLHMGGIDLLPTHHTNEVAQSEAATGTTFVKQWLHVEHLLIDGARMGKSEGNAYTLEDVRARGFDPLDFRYLTFLTHYRKKLNFTWDSLQAAATARRRLQPLLAQSINVAPDSAVITRWQQFVADDLDMPGLVAAVWEYVASDVDDAVKAATVQSVNTVLLDIADSASGPKSIPAAIAELVTQRDAARTAGDFAKADALRNQINDAGFSVEDTAAGSVVVPRYDQK